MTERRVGRSLINFAPRAYYIFYANANFIIVWWHFHSFFSVFSLSLNISVSLSVHFYVPWFESKTKQQSYFLLIQRLLLAWKFQRISCYANNKHNMYMKNVIEFRCCCILTNKQDQPNTNRASEYNCLCYIRFINDFQLEWFCSLSLSLALQKIIEH